jgi:hypothetical protein
MFKRIRAWFGAPASASESPRPSAESPPPSRTSGVLIDFGDNVFSGANISFGSIAGGSLIQNIGPAPGLEQVELAPFASEEHLRDLETVLLEQQTILQQQIERFGDHVPQYMILQLNETQRRLAEIQLRLAQAAPPAE